MDTEINSYNSDDKESAAARESHSPSVVEAQADNNPKATGRDTKDADPDHRKSLRRSWRSASPITKLQIILTAVIAIATVVYAVFAGWQWHEIHSGAAETQKLAKAAQAQSEWARAQTRAWVSVDLRFTGPITFDARGASVKFLLKITNTGHAPAFRVNILPKVINEQSPVIRKQQRETCGLLPDGTNPPLSSSIFWGNTLFPGMDDTQYYDLTITPEELALSKDFGGYFKGRVMPHILGCVDYAIDPSGERRQTFFSYMIMTTVAPEKHDFIEMDKDVPLNSIFAYRDTNVGDAN